MMRTFVITAMLATFPGLVAALGLGEIELDSGLNQPFDARIELLSPTVDEIQSLKIGLADSEAFRRAGIDRPFILSKLKFEVEVTESGADYIHITSEDPIREPFLNFLLEANWSSGRLFREYTVLLDPPMYDPEAGRMASPQTQPSAETSPTVSPAPVRERPRAAPDTGPATTSATGYDGGDYGPTVSNDTLWSIASAVRPDDSVSIQQMMLALLRTNPEAFINNNVNGLKRGHVLRMPDESEINRLSRSEAMTEVRSQYALWDEARGLMADRATERPAGTPDSAGDSVTAAEPGDSELRLRTPDEGTGAGQTDAAGGELRNELALANEQLESLASENRDLQERLTESETIIEDLQRLIALKDDELAAMQQQLAAGDGDGPAAAPEEEDTAAAGEPGPATDEEVAAETDESAAPEEKPAPQAQEPAPAPAGIIETVRGMVMDNLMILAAGIGLIVLAILALVAIRRRSAAGSESGPEEAAPAGGFPDFDESGDSEAPTGVPAGSEDETDFGVGATEDVDLEATAEEETVMAEGGEQESEEAAAPVAEPASGDGEEEEDPLAEVNVFLAYEHFDQAEEFVRDAIKDQPENLDFHSKLLEVFYAAGDKAKYEEEARVLNELVNGEGEYWDMALAMWQEMSPNRALFEEPAEGEDEDSRAETTGGGIVDLTSDVSGDSDAGLDFDLGTEDSAAEETASEDDDEVLDITAGEADPGSLENTVAEGGDEDILDVTAAVGLDSDDSGDTEQAPDEEDDYLDFGGGEESSGKEEDILDVSTGGGSDDPLDVTAHSDMGEDEVEEDLLDVTSATSAGADSDELLGVDAESGEESGNGQSAVEDDDNTLDFDIGGFEDEESGSDDDTGKEPSAANTSGDDDDFSLDFDMDTGDTRTGEGAREETYDDGDSGSGNVIDFDSASGGGDDEDSGLELDLESDDSDEPAFGGERDRSLDDDDSELSLSMDDDEGAEDDDHGLSLDMEMEDDDNDSAGGDDPGLDLDFTLDGGDQDESMSDDTDGGGEDADLSLDIESDDDNAASGDVPEIDMESTVEISRTESDPDSSESSADIPELELDDDDEDDEDDATVFVPRSSGSDEQSSDDEIATRLDLAKAYVELGDKDSAKPILEDIIAEGNDEQRQQAQEMMDQLS